MWLCETRIGKIKRVRETITSTRFFCTFAAFITTVNHFFNTWQCQIEESLGVEKLRIKATIKFEQLKKPL